jgi:pyruvate kinase
VNLPVLTDKDIHDLKAFACKHRVDYVAASFVQSAADVRFIRSVLDEGGGFDIKIISKIENQKGINAFDEILKVSDGIMIARGDLGTRPGACCNVANMHSVVHNGIHHNHT